MHAAQVGALDALRLDVRVADVVSNPTLFRADFTVRCHSFPSGRRVPLALADANRKRASDPVVEVRSGVEHGRARCFRRAWPEVASGMPARAPTGRAGRRLRLRRRRRRRALSGRVVDRRDRPVPEARVLAFPLSGGAGPSETATDLDGRFRFDRLPPGAYRLLIEAAGFPTTEQPSVTAPAEGLVDPRRRRGARRRRAGRGRTARRSRARACCWRRRPADRCGRPSRARAAASPTAGSAQGRYALRATHGESASATARAIEAGEAGTTGPVHLELRPGQRIAGQVIDDAGAGLGGVEVRAESAAEPPGSDPLPTLVASGARGAVSARAAAPRRLSPVGGAARLHLAAHAPRRRDRLRAGARQRPRAGPGRARVRPGSRRTRGARGGRARPLRGQRDRRSDRSGGPAAAGRGGGRVAVGGGAGARHHPGRDGRSAGAASPSTI